MKRIYVKSTFNVTTQTLNCNQPLSTYESEGTPLARINILVCDSGFITTF